MSATQETFRGEALGEAIRTGDRAVIEASLSPDVVLHSPILSTPFEGRDAVTELLAVVSDVLEGLRYEHKMSDGDADVLVAASRVRGVDLESVALYRYDDAGLVREITIFFRPFRATAAFSAVASSPLATSRPRAGLLRAAAPSLRAMAAMVDALSRRTLRLG
jgi:hypothetical protein